VHIPVKSLAAFAAAAAIACYQDDVAAPADTVSTSVLLTDAGFPFELVDRVEVYVSEIAASTDADTTDAQRWVTITRPARTLDLLQLQQGTTALLGHGVIPAGSYRMVRVSLIGDSSHVIMRDGREASVRWPLAGEFALHAWVQEPLAVADTGAQIVIDIDVGRSFVNALGDPLHDFVFLAHLRAVNGAATGTLAGTVRGDADGDGTAEPLPYAGVSVIRGEPFTQTPWFVVATGHAAEDGTYRIAFLLPGTYIVQAEAPSSAVLGSVTAPSVTIERGEITSWSVELPTIDGAPAPAGGPASSGVRY
jgi:hypothetical protein